MELCMKNILKKFDLEEIVPGGSTGENWLGCAGDLIESYSPVSGELIGKVQIVSDKEYDVISQTAYDGFHIWRMIPAPKRGEIVRQMGNRLREYKEPLAELISYEMGKILQEGRGEVQEMIDMADFAVGLSRQLHGFSMHSERPRHRMYEQWHPLGAIGVISAFNFPMAVWSWNAFIALVCGDTVVWKPSSKTPFCALAVHKILSQVLKENQLPEGILNLVVGRGAVLGELLIHDRKLPLISATGSCVMGRRVAEVVGKRLGRTILELGGNNAIIIESDADLNLAYRAVLFGAIGTSGQRCTSTRRLLVNAKIFNKVTKTLVDAYHQVKVGNPLLDETLMGPLIDQQSVNIYKSAIERIYAEGGEVLYGGQVLHGKGYESGCYVEPVIVKAHSKMKIIKEENFVPILYIISYDSLEEAIYLQNNVDQGLSSALFTQNLISSELFLSHLGSDCGIANINIGTSGAEIGGAFGGEKDTGGGREAGSDSWKSYMRRQTNTINWSTELPLAQGIHFELS